MWVQTQALRFTSDFTFREPYFSSQVCHVQITNRNAFLGELVWSFEIMNIAYNHTWQLWLERFRFSNRTYMSGIEQSMHTGIKPLQLLKLIKKSMNLVSYSPNSGKSRCQGTYLQFVWLLRFFCDYFEPIHWFPKATCLFSFHEVILFKGKDLSVIALKGLPIRLSIWSLTQGYVLFGFCHSHAYSILVSFIFQLELTFNINVIF